MRWLRAGRPILQAEADARLGALARVRELVEQSAPSAPDLLLDPALERVSSGVAARLAERPRTSLRDFWHAVEERPLPVLLQAAAVVWVAAVLALRFPGVEAGLRQALDL